MVSTVDWMQNFKIHHAMDRKRSHSYGRVERLVALKSAQFISLALVCNYV